MSEQHNRRILLADDMPAIHEDYRRILLPATATATAELDDFESALFGTSAKTAAAGFTLDSAYQGQEALVMVQEALQNNQPYALAFIDMRMPPGWDGVETIEQLWLVDPRLQIVICTAYADQSWNEVFERLDARDRLLVLKKPFDPIEVYQLASSLTAKWQMAQDASEQLARLEDAVRERTGELRAINGALQQEIEERKHLQSQLVQSEKLASIGQLAAGVAHEINNPIGYVFSNFGTLQGYLVQLFQMLDAYEKAEIGISTSETATRLQKLREEIELDFLKEDVPVLMRESQQGLVRVRQIVQDLKDFSRVDSTPEWEWADLHKGIDSTLNVIASEVKYKAEVVKEYGDIPAVECLPSQINQVVMNLVVNAAHAMGDAHGRITIRTGTLDEQVWLEVADNGNGIPPDTLKRIFEPFFTTKPVGKGTGLGLSLSYGIVKKHQGRIDVESTVGQGTKFLITLPIRRTLAPEDTAPIVDT